MIQQAANLNKINLCFPVFQELRIKIKDKQEFADQILRQNLELHI